MVTFRRPEPFCPITGGALMQPGEKITGPVVHRHTRGYRSDRPMREVNSGQESLLCFHYVSLCAPAPYFKGGVYGGGWT